MHNLDVTLISEYNMAYKILVNLPSAILGIFFVYLSDKINRKLIILLPIVGAIVSTALLLLACLSNIPAIPLIMVCRLT